MNETEARTVLLVRAFESPLEAPWTQADADAVTREAARDLGEAASPDRFVARRAALAATRLAERDRFASTVVRGDAASIGGSLSFVAVFIAFAIGFASDSVAAGGRINILAPPLLALIAWNLAVYLVIVGASWRRERGSVAGAAHPLRSMLTDGVLRWLSTPRIAESVAVRFAQAWSTAARPLHMQRIGAVLHGAALAFACGALASLYLRGLVFEYRAGWDSTFLTPGAVHTWLSWLLGAASRLTGLGLPSAERLAELRFSIGTGENAARWIHLYAVTVVGLVIVPRAWLSAAAMRRAHRLSTAFPIDLQDGYFQRLLRGRSGDSLRCRLLPYSHRPDASAVDNLGRLIEQASGQRVTMTTLPPVAQGDEEDLAALRAFIADDAATLIVAFTLASTPERETQGRLIDGLRSVDIGRRLLIVVDEASFRRRFEATTPKRIDERREAWTRMLHDVGRRPVFVDLSAEASASDQAAIAAAFDPSSA